MSNLRPSWDATFMTMCYTIAQRSPDRSTKVGAVITTADNVFLTMGYNGLPRGMDDSDEYHIRPEKYYFFEHAERNAIFNAARVGIRMDLADKLYVTWMPCADCARAIIQTGIKEVVIHKHGQQAFDHAVGNKSNWTESNNATMHMFKQSGVKYRWFTDPLTTYVTGFFSGNEYAFYENSFHQLKEG